MTSDFGEIIGTSQALKRTLAQIEALAATPANVLVLGESGVGKEMIARAIHARSDRSKKALIKVNCASIPKDLFESEFFGHVKGAFTGALRDRVGRLQLAASGTVFLDEIGDHWTYRASCYAHFRSTNSSASVTTRPSRSTCASSLQPTAICRPRSKPGDSGKTCSIA